MDADLASVYLVSVGLMSAQDTLGKRGRGLGCTLRTSIGHISHLRLIHNEQPIIRFVNDEEDTCYIYTFPESDITRASLLGSDETVLSLMHRDILVLSVESILCNMMQENLCSYSHVPMSGHEDIDRISVIDACIRESGKVLPVYHCSSIDPLTSLGVEYVSCVYIPLISEAIDPSSTLYVAISEDLANSIRFIWIHGSKGHTDQLLP